MIRAVIDTNVLVSSLLVLASPPADIRRAFEQGRFVWCLSEELLEEYRDVLARPKLRKAFKKAGGADACRLLKHLADVTAWSRSPIDVERVVEADPDDDVVLATALALDADVIVSGDAHLTDLKEYRGIPILTPREFVNELAG